MTATCVQVLAAVFLFADAETRDSVRRELLTVMKDGAAIESWANTVFGGQAEAPQKPVGQQAAKKKDKKAKKK